MRKIILLVVVCLAFAISAFAQGMIVPRHHRPGQIPLLVKNQVVEVEVKGNAAITSVEQVFYNQTPGVVEGTYIFPVPKGATVSEFYLWIDGKKVKGELLDKKEAARIYRDIVNRMKDPALLELTDYNLFKASIFPIPARGERKIALKFTQAITPNGSMLAYSYPLRTRSNTMKSQIGQFIFTMNVKSNSPVLSAYSPTHNIDVNRKDENNLVLGFEKKAFVPESDLQIYMALSDKDVGLSFASYRELSGEDGYFMMMLAPKVNLSETKKAAKDVVFVLDTSGSMQSNSKIDQAKSALKFGINSLSEKDRFGLITFATTVNPFRDNLIEATELNKSTVIKHLKQVTASGATNIHDSLKQAFSMFRDSSRPRYLIFLTDGLPTAVERNSAVIAKKAKEWGKGGIRLFSWGVGYDVDAVLLDTLARNHKGTSEYVKPREEMELKMSQFFEKISFPVMTDLSLKFDGITVKDYYPLRLPDLFKGSRIMLFGKFSGEEKGTVTLKGKVDKKEVEFTHKIAANRIEDGEFIAQLWATRKVGFLLEEIRLNGPNKELKDEVITLAKKFGLVTPYTSYLVTEPKADMALASPGIRRRPQEERITITGEAPLVDVRSADQGGTKRVKEKSNVPEYEYELNPECGEMEKKTISSTNPVETSKDLARQKEADKLSNTEKNSKKIGDKTFVLAKDVWTDSLYKKGMKTKTVKFGSDDYFQLLKQNKMMAKWLALGDKVIIVWKDTALLISK